MTWLNAIATISRLCKMTVFTSQVQLLSEGGIHCNVTIENQAVLWYKQFYSLY